MSAPAQGSGVTAKGIERAEDWTELTNAGCDLAQGWLVGRPMPPQAELAWLAECEPAEVLRSLEAKA